VYNALEQALVDSLTFFRLARQAFDFLRTEYHYWPAQTSIIDPDDWRDAAARIRYPGERVGVSIAWYFAAADVSVTFIEQMEPRVFAEHAPYFGRHATSPLAVSLDTLVELSGKRADPGFLLPADSPKRSKTNARRCILESDMAGVLDGLARATKRYATDILAGDTSRFPVIVRYCTEQVEAQTPPLRRRNSDATPE